MRDLKTQMNLRTPETLRVKTKPGLCYTSGLNIPGNGLYYWQV